MRLGLVAIVLVPALVIVGFILVPTNYHAVWNAAQAAPPEAREKLQQTLLITENVMLAQLRIRILFPLFFAIGLQARGRDAGLHKRMMILATATTLSAAINRISWLPTTFPANPLSADFYTLLAVSPMFMWDVVRNRTVHRAYWIWLGVSLPFVMAVHGLWDTEWWHSTARWLMGV